MAGLEPRLIELARRGDAQAFAAIVHHYQQRIYALAYRLTYSTELARDVTQDVFLRLYQQLDRYDSSRPFEPWFLKLASNYTLNARAKARLRRTHSLDAPTAPGQERSPEPADSESTPVAHTAGTEEARVAVHQAIRELPDKYAAVIVLHYLEGLGVREIAAQLDMPEGTVKIRLYRGRNVLREKLERFDQG